MDFSDVKEMAGILLIVTAIFVGSIIVIGIPINLMERKSCLESYSEYKSQYSFFAGCRIEYKGKMTPTNMIKNININQ